MYYKSVLLLSATVFLFACTDDSAKESHDTLQSCAELLPEGDLYFLEIRGTIDTGTKPPTLEGAYEVTAEDGDSQSMKPFTECMRKIIQPAPEKGAEIETGAVH